MQKLRILWYKFQAKAISSFVNLFASQSNFEIKNTVLLVGSTRSGTTFLMESLNSKNDYRLIFEPFNPTYSKEWSSFSPRHYIDPQSVGDNEKQVIDNILRGKINNTWVDQYNRKLKSEKRLIKSVRANLMLDYIEQEYPDLQIIYIYRNPYDVVASRINLIFDPNDIHLILEHKAFLKKHYLDINIKELESLLKFPECCHAALWCLENRYLLRNQKQRRLKITKFEYVLDKTTLLVKDELVVSNRMRQPSVTSSLRKSYELSDSEVENINKVLSIFEMEEYIRKL